MQTSDQIPIMVDKMAAQVTVICSAIVIAKMVFSNYINGIAKAGTGNRVPED